MNLTIICNNEANPIVTNNKWSWTHNGKFISYGNRLLLSNVSFLNSGLYECGARNKAGFKKNSIKIEVYCKIGSCY